MLSLFIKKKMSSFFRKTEEEKERKKSFLVNGSALLDEIIVSFNGRHNIPIRSFTVEELFQATNGFKNWFHETASGAMFKGSFEQRPIVVLYNDYVAYPALVSVFIHEAIHNMVITSQMSHHKNVLRLLGCCLEYKVPALVYEYSGTQVLSDMLYSKEGVRTNRLLSWNRRLNIAKDIASVVVYLHTAFPTPIIHRDIRVANVVIDQFGVAKLFDFGLCISLPPGESQVEVDVVRVNMAYTEPEYALTGIVTEKIDTFYFGMLLLELLTAGKFYQLCFRKNMYCVDYVRNCIENGKLYEILDPAILGDGGGGAEQDHQQIEAFLTLALKCSQDKREDRPYMIDVAKELRRVERSEAWNNVNHTNLQATAGTFLLTFPSTLTMEYMVSDLHFSIFHTVPTKQKHRVPKMKNHPEAFTHNGNALHKSTIQLIARQLLGPFSLASQVSINI